MDVCHLGGLSDRKTIYMQIEHKIQASDMPRGARRVWLGASAVPSNSYSYICINTFKISFTFPSLIIFKVFICKVLLLIFNDFM